MIPGKAKLALYTNGVSEHQWKKIAGTGLENWIAKEHLFVSDDIGYAKPDVRGYKLIEAKMDTTPEHTYFVGDSISMDMAGAKDSNWNMIFINRRNHDLTTSKHQPDYIVYNEEELLELLKTLV